MGLIKPYHDLIKYGQNNFFNGNYGKVQLLCQNIRWKCVEGIDVQLVFDMFNIFGLKYPRRYDFWKAGKALAWGDKGSMLQGLEEQDQLEIVK